MDLKQLLNDQAYEFLFAWAPLKLVGATGSPGNPIAAYLGGRLQGGGGPGCAGPSITARSRRRELPS